MPTFVPIREDRPLSEELLLEVGTLAVYFGQVEEMLNNLLFTLIEGCVNWEVDESRRVGRT